MSQTLLITTTETTEGYELLDSGNNEKLERYGSYWLRRPDPQALWLPQLGAKEWNKAHAQFRRDAKKADWQLASALPTRWSIAFAGLQLWIRPTSFKHTGLFPEQAPNWDWIREQIAQRRAITNKPISVLNLFGYTGGATLAAAQAGAEVCHVDGSKVALQWARDNASLSGLEKAPIRWILDDARSFVAREVKRGRHYEGIILDPPAFGHGPHKELWQIEDHLVPLLALCKKVLSSAPLFFLVNGYASGYSAIAYENNLQALLGSSGMYEKGELTIQETNSNRLLPCGIFARWCR